MAIGSKCRDSDLTLWIPCVACGPRPEAARASSGSLNALTKPALHMLKRLFKEKIHMELSAAHGFFETRRRSEWKVKPEQALNTILLRVGNNLAKLRIQKGYTSIRAFSDKFDLPEIQYWRMENGKTNVTLRSLSKVLHIHKLSLQEFFCLVNSAE